VDKAVGVDRPSLSFVDRPACPAAPELNRRAGRDAQHDQLPGLEPLDCDAVMASRDIVAGYATGGCDGVAAAVRWAAAPGSEAVLSELMWRSRHAIANQVLLTAGKLHPDKKIAKAARGGLGEGKLGQELGQEPLTGLLLADASRGGAAERSLSCGSAWSV
jgi:hypothetical protein